MHKTISTCLLVLMLIIFHGCSPIEEDFDTGWDGKNVGVSASDLLTDSRFTELVIEVMVVKGFEPKTKTFDSLVVFLDSLIDKPTGIRFVFTEIESPGRPIYTMNDIRVLESQNRTQFSEGSRLAISVFFADEHFAENLPNQMILGRTYANTSIVIFQKTILFLTDHVSKPDQSLMEQTILNHEFGHVMGLVNQGSEMQTGHQDEAHGFHCDNLSCLMHWTVESDSISAGLLQSGKVPEFGQNCLDDLKAKKGL